jgi:hypothetical protein
VCSGGVAGSILQASSFTADSLIRLARIKSGMGAPAIERNQ